jgi:hypothetical protein
MVLKETAKILKEKFGSYGDISIVSIKGNTIEYQVPYDKSSFEVEITTNTVKEQLEEFYSEVDNHLDNMENFIGDIRSNLKALLFD